MSRHQKKAPGTAAGTGRPLTDEMIAVAIPERGLKALWDAERKQFVGDPEITRWANLYATTSHVYGPVGRESVTCGIDSDEAILASLLAACGGRGVVLGERPVRRATG